MLVEGATLAGSLTDVTTVLTTVTDIITGSAILMTMFAAGLIGVGAKAFKAIKRAVK